MKCALAKEFLRHKESLERVCKRFPEAHVHTLSERGMAFGEIAYLPLEALTRAKGVAPGRVAAAQATLQSLLEIS